MQLSMVSMMIASAVMILLNLPKVAWACHDVAIAHSSWEICPQLELGGLGGDEGGLQASYAYRHDAIMIVPLIALGNMDVSNGSHRILQPGDLQHVWSLDLANERPAAHLELGGLGEVEGGLLRSPKIAWACHIVATASIE